MERGAVLVLQSLPASSLRRRAPLELVSRERLDFELEGGYPPGGVGRERRVPAGRGSSPPLIPSFLFRPSLFRGAVVAGEGPAGERVTPCSRRFVALSFPGGAAVGAGRGAARVEAT